MTDSRSRFLDAFLDDSRFVEKEQSDFFLWCRGGQIEASFEEYVEFSRLQLLRIQNAFPASSPLRVDKVLRIDDLRRIYDAISPLPRVEGILPRVEGSL